MFSIPQHPSADSAAAASLEFAGARFPRIARLLTPKQYQSVFSQGRRLNGALFRLHVCIVPTDDPTQQGSNGVEGATTEGSQAATAARLAASTAAAIAADPNVTGAVVADVTVDTSPPRTFDGRSQQALSVGANAPTDARLGIAVSRRVDPHAVGRNRIKRVARDSFRHVRGQLPAGDYVLLAQRAAADANNEQLRQALSALWLRAGAASPSLKRGAAAVTMHADIDAGPPQPPRQPPSS